MKYHILIKGMFTNVKGLVIAQNYFVSIKCASCNTEHKKAVFVSDQDKKKVAVKEPKGKFETFNLTVECKECKNLMCIKIHEPEDRIYHDDMYLFPINNDSCHVSTFISDQAVPVDVDGLILDAVSCQGVLFENCSFNERTLAEDDCRGKTIDIQKFEIAIEQIK
ncbi:hypothetical protein ENBRE01_1262 [Enteropsectra breve]|nr:hypothetical protein ENBRE01_1262 [Enteropsectra breve]